MSNSDRRKDKDRAESRPEAQHAPAESPELSPEAAPEPQLEVAPVLQLNHDPRRARSQEESRKRALALGVCFAVGALAVVGLTTAVNVIRGMHASAAPNAVGPRPTVASSILDAIHRLRTRPLKEFFSPNGGGADPNASDAAKLAKAGPRGARTDPRGAQTAMRGPAEGAVGPQGNAVRGTSTAPRDSLAYITSALPVAADPMASSAAEIGTSHVGTQPGANAHQNVGPNGAGPNGTNPGAQTVKPTDLHSMLKRPNSAKGFSDMLKEGLRKAPTVDYRTNPAEAAKFLKQVPDVSNAFSGTSPTFTAGDDMPSQEFMTADGQRYRRAEEVDVAKPLVTPICGSVEPGGESKGQQLVLNEVKPVRTINGIEQVAEAVQATPGKKHGFDYCCVNVRWVPPDTRLQTEINNCVHISPLVFDLAGGRGVQTSDLWIRYDVRGSGQDQRIHDIGPGMGLLVFDADKDGVAGTSGLELFGERTSLNGAKRPDGFKDGFDALQALAAMAEAEGVLPKGTVASRELGPEALRALGRAYGLGMRVGSVAAETVRLEDAGVRAIRLSAARSTAAADLNGIDDVIRRDGAMFVRADGTTGSYEDVLFQVVERVPSRRAADARTQAKPSAPRAGGAR
ncbi:MAG: hypothetical protein HY078_16330 [Elusimicrobia bacterium]|nr:hypothetical protein [Elusimicrobiota bacterium]